MFPIIAIGAALIGGFAIEQSVAASSDPKDSKSSQGPAKTDPQDVASPQSYVVTPISSSTARQITPLEAVRNLIF